MRKYLLRLPGGWSGSPWEADLASNRQAKLSRFFGCLPAGKLSKGEASALIDEIFADVQNERRWNAYKELTGDYGNESADLLPFSLREVDRVAAGRPAATSWGRWAWVATAAAALIAGLVSFILSQAQRGATNAPNPGATAPSLAALTLGRPSIDAPPVRSTAAAPAPPRLLPPLTPTTVVQSRAAAIGKRPELAIAGSPLHRDFHAEMERLKSARDPILKEARHPQIIADRVADEIVLWALTIAAEGKRPNWQDLQQRAEFAAQQWEARSLEVEVSNLRPAASSTTDGEGAPLPRAGTGVAR